MPHAPFQGNQDEFVIAGERRRAFSDCLMSASIRYVLDFDKKRLPDSSEAVSRANGGTSFEE